MRLFIRANSSSKPQPAPPVPMLGRKVWADTVALARRTLSLTVLIGLGITSFCGMYQAYQNLETTYGRIYQGNRFADASVLVDRAPESLVDTARTIPHVTAAMGRVVRDGFIDQRGRENRHVLGRFIGVPRGHRPPINNIQILEGRYVISASEALLEHSFARSNHYALGDTLECRYAGSRREFTIVGFFLSPEYLYPVPDRHVLFVDRERFGVLLIDEDRARSWLQVGRQVTEIHCLTEPGYEQEVTDKLEGLAHSYGVDVAFTQKMQPSVRLLEMDQTGFAVMSVFFPVLFLISAAFSLYGALARVVRLQVPIIGTMKANGFSDRQILVQQVLQGGLVALAGAIPGVILGHLLSVWLGGLYIEALHLPELATPIHWDTVTAGLCMAVITGLLAAYLPARTAARLQPSVAMRGDVAGGDRLGIQQRLVGWTGFGPVLLRIPLRGIARRLSGTLLAVAGVASGVIIIVTTFGLYCAFLAALDEFLTYSRRYEIDVGFTGPQDMALAEAVTALPGGRAVTFTATVPVRMKSTRGEGELLLTGLEPGQTLMRVRTLTGEPMRVQPGRLWIPKQLARALHVEPGDPVWVEWVRSSRRRHTDRVMQIAGILDVAMGNSAYGEYHDVRRSFADRVFPFSSYGAYVATDPNRAEAFRRRLDEFDAVANVSTTADIKEQIDEQMALMWIFIGVLLGFGMILAGSSIHTVASVALLERTRELATLRSLGFPALATAWLVALELGFLALLGLALGLPLGSALNTLYLKSVETEILSYKAVLPPWVHVTTTLLVFLLVAWSSYVGMRKLQAMDLSQATKARE